MAGRGVQHLPLGRIPAQWDPKWFANFVRDVLAFADVRNAEGSGVTISGNTDEVATIALSADVAALLAQRFVVTSSSPFLAHERVLAGEDGVIEVTDGGDNANVTVSIATNGVPLAKLQLLSDFGVLGSRFPGGGQAVNIAPSADGQALTSDGITLDWKTAPVWHGDHQWLDGFGILLGTDADCTIEHDGTDAHFDNVTGDSLFTTAGDHHLAALTFTVETNGVERLHIDDDGAWNLASDPGGAGDVLTSAGAGAPPTWETPSAGGGGNVTPDTHPGSANALDDEFEAGSLDAKWSWRNQGSATAAFLNGAIRINALANASDDFKIIEQACPSGDWKVRAKFTFRGEASDFPQGGFILYRTTGPKSLVFGVTYESGYKRKVSRFNGTSTWVANVYGPTDDSLRFGPVNRWAYYEIERSGTNYIFRASATGVDGTFVTLATEAQATHLGGAADTIGLYTSSSNGSNAVDFVCDWFRRVA